jgi:uncharacterized protein (UPF0335 family)
MGRRKNGGATDQGAKIGHNSNLNQDEKVKLSGFISEIERIDQQARDISSERGTLYKSAKEAGFDTKALKRVIQLRRMEKTKRDEHDAAVDAYMHAMGDFVTTPLGQAGIPAGAEAH